MGSHKLLTVKGPAVVNVQTHNYDTYVGRVGHYGNPKWGNPFKLGKDGNRAEVIKLYDDWIADQPQLIKQLPELWGKVLGCHCAGAPIRPGFCGLLGMDPVCHGEVLMRRANEPSMNPLIAERFWVSGKLPSFGKAPYFCCLVCVDSKSRIVWTADLLKSFIGQDIENLIAWGKGVDIQPIK